MTFIIFITIKQSCAQAVMDPIAASNFQWQGLSRHHHHVLLGSSNQASLAEVKQFSAGFYGERKYLVSEMSHYMAALAFPLDAGRLGLNAAYFGNPSHNETKLGLAYARTLGAVDVGVQFNYFRFSTAGYQPSSAINIEAGMLLQLNDEIITGIHLYNPAGTRFGNIKEERLPLICTVGIGYDVSENFLLAGVIQKMEDHPVNMQAGVLYRFHKKLWAKAGISTATPSCMIGVGLLLNDFQLEINFAYHQILGLTPGMLVIYQQQEP
jgi:hypothetical protein